MPHDDDVGLHGLQGVHRVDERLPLDHARGGHGNVDEVRREPLGGEFEANPGAGGGLVEEEADGLSAEDRNGLHGAGEKVLEIPCRFTYQLNLFD